MLLALEDHQLGAGAGAANVAGCVCHVAARRERGAAGGREGWRRVEVMDTSEYEKVWRGCGREKGVDGEFRQPQDFSIGARAIFNETYARDREREKPSRARRASQQCRWRRRQRGIVKS